MHERYSTSSQPIHSIVELHSKSFIVIETFEREYMEICSCNKYTDFIHSLFRLLYRIMCVCSGASEYYG